MTSQSREEDTSTYGFAVFPLLKTNAPFTLGSFTFRSTDDCAGLSEADADHMRAIADMLFLRDDFRIKSATCAVAPGLDFTKPSRSRPPHAHSPLTIMRQLAETVWAYTFMDYFLLDDERRSQAD